MTKRKVLVIGLDGATFDLIKPWIKEGKLPTFKKLMERGVYGNLKSTIPPFTGPAWTSFVTGKNPEKHGIFYFFKLRNHKMDLVNINDIQSRTVLDILDKAGKRSIVINLPLTYPPKQLNGFMITGMFTPSESHEYTYPPSLKQEIEKITTNYIIEPAFSFEKLKQEKISILFQALEDRYKVMRHLMKKDWDFFFILFRETDIVQHHFWNDKRILVKVYKKIDTILGEIIKQKNTNILIMSDHGFQSLKGIFHVNKLLLDNGFLNIHHRKKTTIERIGLSEQRVHNFIVKHNLFSLKKFVKKHLPPLTESFSKKDSWTMDEDIDWNRTKAFFDGGGIHINRDVVPEGEYDEVKQSIIDLLKNTGIKIKIHAFDKPDIVLEPDNWKIDTSISLKAKNVFEKTDGGTHAIDGILIAYGPDIKQNTKIKQTHISDLAPTILHVFDIPLPRSMDGIVLKRIFKTSSDLSKKKIKYTHPQKYKEIERSEEDKTQIENILKELGY